MSNPSLSSAMPASGPLASISISSVRIINNHAEYAIERGHTRVWRRFRDFENLRKSLLLGAASPKEIPELPPKQTWWASRSESVVNQRKFSLEAFLRKMEETPGLLVGDKRIAWEGFFDNGGDFETSGTSSTYLDSSGVLAHTTSSSYSTMANGSGSSSQPPPAAGSDAFKRLEGEMTRLQASMKKASSSSQEDFSRFLKAWEEEKEESKALRLKVTELEHELAQLRVTKAAQSNPPALHLDKLSPIGRNGENAAVGSSSNSFDDAAEENDDSSLPSLESDLDDPAERPSESSELTNGSRKYNPTATDTDRSSERDRKAERKQDASGAELKTSAGQAPLTSQDWGHTSKTTQLPNQVLEVKDVPMNESGIMGESGGDDDIASLCSASSLKESSVSATRNKNVSTTPLSLNESFHYNKMQIPQVTPIASTKDDESFMDDSNIESSFVQSGASSNGQDEGAPLAHLPTPLKLTTTVKGTGVRPHPNRKTKPISPAINESVEDSFVSTNSAASTSTSRERKREEKRLERALASAKEEDLTRRLFKLSSKQGFDGEDGSTTSKKPRSVVDEERIILALVRAMQLKGRDSPIVALFGCKSVLNLSSDVEMCQRLGQEGVCEAVCACLLEFVETDEQVALEACGAICNLAFVDDNARRLVKAGAFTGLCFALSRYGRTNSAMAFSALSAVINLFLDPSCMAKFVRGRGMKYVCLVLKRWASDDSEIATEACVIIRNLAEDLRWCRVFGTYGACEAVVQALNTFGSNGLSVKVEGCLALRNLAVDASNRNAIGASGGCEALVKCLREMIDNSKGDEESQRMMCLHGLLSIRNLSSKHPINCSKLGAAGACQLVMDIAKWVSLSLTEREVDEQTKEDDEELAYACCAAIWNLSFDDQNATELVTVHNYMLSSFLVDMIERYGCTNIKLSSVVCGAVCKLVLLASSDEGTGAEKPWGAVVMQEFKRGGLKELLRHPEFKSSESSRLVLELLLAN